MVNYQREFIENLKYYRKEKGLTQAQLAEMCNVSNGTIGNIETGITKPSFDLILQISTSLEIQPEYLFHTEEQLQKTKTDSELFTKEQLKKLRLLLNNSVSNIINSLEKK